MKADEGRDIFYWFFNSRNDPKNDPIIIYLSGGPGALSMPSVVTGVGPCTLNSTDDKVVGTNPWSWNNNASLLFIDQPAGTGFSKLADDLPLPVREQDTAEDFHQFLKTFFDDIFPNKSELPNHLATSSYGGHYGPVYFQHVMESRGHDPDNAFWGNIQSLIPIDAVIDFTSMAVGGYEMVC